VRTIPPVEPKGRRLLALADFASSSGEPFDPHRHTVTELLIACDSRRGHGSYSWKHQS
jgi:hypothetical protein